MDEQIRNYIDIWGQYSTPADGTPADGTISFHLHSETLHQMIVQ